jgi:hypothetical protein
MSTTPTVTSSASPASSSAMRDHDTRGVTAQTSAATRKPTLPVELSGALPKRADTR